ncbi:hypothetical protein NM688_g4113 [Phlebia brevispora]|uniref:Uncharacterized protein n=1 Tax=Phlebia brevispora TaxID=194682 RepID=A0ACC1T4F8_9APHY|nr:hypothetical protein NM688_g4113 [Phlebia brevispora]
MWRNSKPMGYFLFITLSLVPVSCLGYIIAFSVSASYASSQVRGLECCLIVKGDTRVAIVAYAELMAYDPLVPHNPKMRAGTGQAHDALGWSKGILFRVYLCCCSVTNVAPEYVASLTAL